MTENNQNIVEEPAYITLEFDDDKEIECEIIGVFDFNEKEYIALFPTDGSEETWFYEYQEVNEEEFKLVEILNEKEFDAVVAEFDALMSSLEE